MLKKYPTSWTALLASALLGLGMATLSTVLGGDQSLALANGALGVIVPLLLAELLTRARRDHATTLLESITRDDQLRTLVEDSLRSRHAISELQQSPTIRAFFRDRFNELCTDPSWRELSEGRLVISPQRELSFNKEALSICNTVLQAVSYQDGAFWNLPEGRSFLEANAAFIESGKQCTRIFIVDDGGANASTVEHMRSQAELGVDVRVLPPTSTSEDDRLDFVLYDELAVRVAESATGVRKRAALLVDPRQVQHYVERFKNLVERTLTLEDYLSLHAPTSATPQ